VPALVDFGPRGEHGDRQRRGDDDRLPAEVPKQDGVERGEPITGRVELLAGLDVRAALVDVRSGREVGRLQAAAVDDRVLALDDGIGPVGKRCPVAISIACPASSAGGFVSGNTAFSTISSGPSSSSANAYPSMVARSIVGWAVSATIGSARRWPAISATGTVDVARSSRNSSRAVRTWSTASCCQHISSYSSMPQHRQ